ncbi:MAG TPA: ABC transporter permease [Rhodanobacter sp.]|nr:ABC transporter permease [Rhodanobacter sp.]
MTVHPILAALRRHKVAVLLIVLQIALTLAIVANALFIIGQHIQRMERPTGADEKDLIWVLQQWPGLSGGDDVATLEKIDALQRTDLEILRHLPDVQDAAASTSIPILSGFSGGHITLDPNQQGLSVHAAYYFGDQRLRHTLGLHLIAGRDFDASEIRHGRAKADAPAIIVSKPVADALFPNGNALGQTVYQDGSPATIVGIVERLQTPKWADSNWAYNSALEPFRDDDRWSGYVVRARPGRVQAAIREARKALLAVNPMRLMPEPSAGVHAFSEIRARAYRQDRGMVLLMSVISAILLCVTAAGIVGLISFWVGQRTRQIGVRRALGARKVDILRYFQLENLLIAGGGAVVGALFAVGLNEWLMTHVEMTRLPLSCVALGVLVMLTLGQAAVLVPAQRASNVPPVVATRSV